MTAPQRKDFRFAERHRVRWVEVDMQAIVFNGHYLMYFDTAVAGYWRALALPYHDTMRALGGDLFVRKATIEYEASARYAEFGPFYAGMVTPVEDLVVELGLA